MGFQSAGLTAAAAARLFDRNARITVIERRTYATYHPCGLPFAIGGEVPDIHSLVDAAPKTPGVDVQLGKEAKSIDTNAKKVEIQDRKTLKSENVSYDSLILATGSVALKPPIPGVDLKKVFNLRTLRDAEGILEALPTARKAVVIGAGLIGVEAACAMKGRGIETTIVEMQPSVLPGMLDLDMAEVVKDHLSRSGISIKCDQPVQELRGKEKVTSVVTKDGEISADIVIIAVGVKTDVELAAKAGIKLGPMKAIAVDDHLLTSAPDVYAAGDCAEARCFITNRPIRSQLATTSIRMGKVAGVNAAGGEEVFSGVLNTAVSIAHGLEFASTGLTSQSAKDVGMEVVVGRIRTLSRPQYFPGAEPIIIKLVVSRKDRKIVGGQVIGDGAAERANLLALSIKQGVTVDELSRMDYCYAPPVNDFIEPVVVAADALLRRM